MNRSRKSRCLEDRFWDKVDKKNSEDCWLWTASTQKGYGQIGVKGRRSPEKAHRVSWMIHFGNIPAGMSVLHKCDNPLCVNPDHLFLGTQADNMRDMDAKNRRVSTGARNQMGEGNNASKLNDTLVRYIRSQRISGKSVSELANELQVDRKTIWLVANRRTWRHVE